LNIIF